MFWVRGGAACPDKGHTFFAVRHRQFNDCSLSCSAVGDGCDSSCRYSSGKSFLMLGTVKDNRDKILSPDLPADAGSRLLS